MKKKWAAFAVIVLLVLLPVIVHIAWRAATAMPREITIATGPQRGLYCPLCDDLAAELRKSLPGVKVYLVETNGSLENLRQLEEGKADFALYQPGTLEVSGEPPRKEIAEVAFVANLYSQPAHVIVPRDSQILCPADLIGKRISVGLDRSGDLAMSTMLLNHLGLDTDSSNLEKLTYTEVAERFGDESLDAAFVTVGVRAPIFQDLLAGGKCDVLSIPYRDALVQKHVSMSRYDLPQGFYRTREPAVPSEDVHTVAMGAHLLTCEDTHAGLVHEVTRLVLNQRFIKRHHLRELSEQERFKFARQQPSFPVHPGAQAFYDPEFDMHSFESWEAIYSLVASTVIAGFLGGRWYRRQRARMKEHRLDRYMHSLLEIERRQLTLDDSAEADDAQSLQKLLDEVTFLRQEALGEFTAHELAEDRAADCFISMCHALSNKINAKLTRQRFDKRIDELTTAVQRDPPGDQ
ncbi:MAG: TAXI family TRAP transporter solute-binding subunit [Candidatus Nealsonbacteria bacterium]|nr:TAXI family TRAP transporter solute-binding subunit [Candidatus Nealsonbacteria bacterium]